MVHAPALGNSPSGEGAWVSVGRLLYGGLVGLMIAAARRRWKAARSAVVFRSR